MGGPNPIPCPKGYKHNFEQGTKSLCVKKAAPFPSTCSGCESPGSGWIGKRCEIDLNKCGDGDVPSYLKGPLNVYDKNDKKLLTCSGHGQIQNAPGYTHCECKM